MGSTWELIDKIGIVTGLLLFLIEIIQWFYILKVKDDVEEIQEDIDEIQEDIEYIEEQK